MSPASCFPPRHCGYLDAGRDSGTPAQLSRLQWCGGHAVACLYLIQGIKTDVLVYLADLACGMKVTPEFDRPFLSCSCCEMWGKRWCLPAGTLLRQLIYEPVVEGLAGLFAVLCPSNTLLSRYGFLVKLMLFGCGISICVLSACFGG